MSRTNPRYHRTNPPMLPLGSGNIMRYSVIGSISGQQTVNILDFYASVPSPTVAQMAALLTAISTAFFPKYKACMSTDWSCVQEQLRCISLANLANVVSGANGAVLGTNANGASSDTEVATVIIKYTALKGQHGRGRMSLPGVPGACIQNSQPSLPSYTGPVATLGAQLIMVASDGTNNWTSCISQRSNTPPRLATGYEIITGWSMSKYLGTIRRRKIGRGR